MYLSPQSIPSWCRRTRARKVHFHTFLKTFSWRPKWNQQLNIVSTRIYCLRTCSWESKMKQVVKAEVRILKNGFACISSHVISVAWAHLQYVCAGSIAILVLGAGSISHLEFNVHLQGRYPIVNLASTSKPHIPFWIWSIEPWLERAALWGAGPTWLSRSAMSFHMDSKGQFN